MRRYLTGAGGVEEPYVYGWDFVIEKILPRQKIQTNFADAVRVQRMKRLVFGDRNCRCRHSTILGARAGRDDYGQSPQSSHGLKQVQRSHDVRLKGSDRICPGDSRQALRAKVKNMRRLNFFDDLCNALAVAEIALGDS